MAAALSSITPKAQLGNSDRGPLYMGPVVLRSVSFAKKRWHRGDRFVIDSNSGRVYNQFA